MVNLRKVFSQKKLQRPLAAKIYIYTQMQKVMEYKNVRDLHVIMVTMVVFIICTLPGNQKFFYRQDCPQDNCRYLDYKHKKRTSVSLYCKSHHFKTVNIKSYYFIFKFNTQKLAIRFIISSLSKTVKRSFCA